MEKEESKNKYGRQKSQTVSGQLGLRGYFISKMKHICQKRNSVGFGINLSLLKREMHLRDLARFTEKFTENYPEKGLAERLVEGLVETPQITPQKNKIRPPRKLYRKLPRKVVRNYPEKWSETTQKSGQKTTQKGSQGIMDIMNKDRDMIKNSIQRLENYIIKNSRQWLENLKNCRHFLQNCFFYIYNKKVKNFFEYALGI
ncbi:hypothetical protein KY366_06725 [Candidatus Woesearchaeota archaeon]|nr:hypothetical protein [Candidatus Woesearchaeota archaeon]